MLGDVQLSVSLMQELAVKIYVLSDELKVLDVEEKFKLHESHILALNLSEKVSSHIIDELITFI